MVYPRQKFIRKEKTTGKGNVNETSGNGKQLRFDNILFHKDGLVFTWLSSIVFDQGEERNFFSFYLYGQFL